MFCSECAGQLRLTGTLLTTGTSEGKAATRDSSEPDKLLIIRGCAQGSRPGPSLAGGVAPAAECYQSGKGARGPVLTWLLSLGPRARRAPGRAWARANFRAAKAFAGMHARALGKQPASRERTQRSTPPPVAFAARASGLQALDPHPGRRKRPRPSLSDVALPRATTGSHWSVRARSTVGPWLRDETQGYDILSPRHSLALLRPRATGRQLEDCAR